MIVSALVTTAESPGLTGNALCPVATRCGGCPRIFESCDEQRAAKAGRVAALLALKGLAVPYSAIWIDGPVTGYRNRIRLAMVDGTPCFFNAEKLSGCVVLEPALQACVSDFRNWARAYQVPLRPFRVAEVRTPDADGKAAVYLRHTERNGAPKPAPDRSLLPNTFSSCCVAFEDGPVEFQRVYCTPDVWLWSPVGGFGQVNTLVNQRMVQTVVGWLLAADTRTFVDLFSGSGNFSVPLRATGVVGVAVEWEASACEAHALSLKSHGFDGVEVVRGDALAHAHALWASGRRFDAVVLDPPRRGLRGNVAAVVGLARHSVVLVSCNAEQFATDAAAICAAGFRMADYRLVDMFPHTEHVELIAHFVRA